MKMVADSKKLVQEGSFGLGEVGDVVDVANHRRVALVVARERSEVRVTWRLPVLLGEEVQLNGLFEPQGCVRFSRGGFTLLSLAESLSCLVGTSRSTYLATEPVRKW